MHFLDIILKKRNGDALTTEEINFFVSAYVEKKIPDYQVSALLMAIFFSKMSERETHDLTFAMRDSGDKIDLSEFGTTTVDKHSTGGVADTTSLITAPIVAACGLTMAKMSGRGLGHTGGTIDKLESIPGFTTSISMLRFKEILNSCGMSIIGQTSSLVPADKMLYALRDTTGTVDNISLIASSIMSKKLASGATTLVLDVKTGNGAFMKQQDEAKALARAMVSIGKAAGKRVQALVTDMNQPLGMAVGNSLEVKEAIQILQGNTEGDLKTVSIALAAQLLFLSGTVESEGEAVKKAENTLNSGDALAQFSKMVAAQGGHPAVCENPDLLPAASSTVTIKAQQGGYISKVLTDEIGMSAMLLGAGRATKEDSIDPAVGIWLKKRLGDKVEEGDELATFHVNSTKQLDHAKSRFLDAIKISDRPIKSEIPLIYSKIS